MKSRLEEKDQDLSYRHINLEMPTRQSRGHAEQTVGCDSLSSEERNGLEPGIGMVIKWYFKP